ncbi:MAG: lysine--tRNA ligase [Alphaproteobacteria bacterium]|jgi:lysyl-tRNA synthetase, class I|nr:lysine--tRNA ligase [Alphaproteobacteria bacterium]MBT4710457.1 lysine--tRNA ligase [Alphaproteobacteria bacterium]MBT5860966.1 lysine--tRNA ligase [Alphaproteobacteria bacterium]
MSDISDAAMSSKAWPFREARKLIKRLENSKSPIPEVVFQTGYGPSGLPHIGTFGEVARTTMVRQAFDAMSDVPSRLIAFSDDMDGMRAVPDNIPNGEMLAAHIGKPLSQVPDPFGTHESFAHHNNAMLRDFLDRYGFDYEFLSATECYQSGRFDDAMKTVLRHHQAVVDVVSPTLGEARRATYSPFLPVSKVSGKVLQAAILETDAEAGTLVYREEDGTPTETLVTGGLCKLQWKADWAMRWKALGAHYEMSGKDLIDSVRLSSRICKVIGGRPPETFIYELFLDENGEKISKSRGNGLTIDDWLAYASPESLQLYMFQSPGRAKRLFFDIIPKAVDEYLSHLSKFGNQEPSEQLANPAWFIHHGAPPDEQVPVSFAMLLNLVSACNTDDPDVLWGFLGRYAPGASPTKNPILDQMVAYAIRYYQDFIVPTKSHRAPDSREQKAMDDLIVALQGIPDGAMPEDIQTEVYAVGRENGYENLRDWFKTLYEVLFGQTQGPRMGSVIALYGVAESIQLIERGRDGQLVD